MKAALTILVAALLLHSARGQVGPMPGSQRVGPAFQASSLVCSCLAKQIEVVAHRVVPGTPVVHEQVRASVQIEDIYKSEPPASGQVEVQYEQDVPSSSASQPTLWPNEKAILFLKTKGLGLYEFADPFLGATPFHALPQRGSGAGMNKLESALVSVLRQPNRDDRLNALRMLQGFDSLNQNSLAIVNTLTGPEDPEIAFAALAVLLKTRTPSAVDELRQYAENYKGSAEPISLISAGTELGEITNEKALPTIEALTSSRFFSVRYGAMQSLHRMKNPQAAAVLVQRLEEPDKTIKYLAVITLAETFQKYEGDYAPSMYLFDKKPQYYIDLWKKWWSDEGSKLYSTSAPSKN